MGKEVVVNSLEEMCGLMCDNRLPKQKEHEYCLRCGRKLKNPRARLKGFGVMCEKKMRKVKKGRLF